MKILHTITSLDKGGAENHLVILAREQSLNNNKVSIYVSKNSFYWLKFLKKNKIKVFKSNFFNEKNFIYKIIKLVFDIYNLVLILKKNRPDIVHAHLPYMEIVSYLSLFFVNSNTKFFISKHVDNVFFKGSDGQKKSSIGSLIAKIISIRANKIIAISKAVKNFLSSRFVGISKNKIKVVYYGLDNLNLLSKKNTNLTKIKRNKKELILGCIARLVPQKSVENILESIMILSKENIKLIIVGRGPLKEKFISFTKKNKIEKKVIWINFLDDVKNFYNNIDVFVLTSKYEGLGLVFLEAMLSKKPIIASKVSAMPEIIKNNYNGFLIKPNNPKLLAKTIRKFKNKNLRNKLGINGFHYVKKNFKVDKMYREIQKIYKK